MISSILFKNYRTPDKFTDLLTYLINGGGNTDLAIYIKDGGNVLHGSDIFKDDFSIVNSVIYPNLDLSNFSNSVVMELLFALSIITSVLIVSIAF
jgi:hypothetical protein